MMSFKSNAEENLEFYKWLQLKRIQNVQAHKHDPPSLIMRIRCSRSRLEHWPPACYQNMLICLFYIAKATFDIVDERLKFSSRNSMLEKYERFY